MSCRRNSVVNGELFPPHLRPFLEEAIGAKVLKFHKNLYNVDKYYSKLPLLPEQKSNAMKCNILQKHFNGHFSMEIKDEISTKLDLLNNSLLNIKDKIKIALQASKSEFRNRGDELIENHLDPLFVDDNCVECGDVVVLTDDSETIALEEKGVCNTLPPNTSNQDFKSTWPTDISLAESFERELFEADIMEVDAFENAIGGDLLDMLLTSVINRTKLKVEETKEFSCLTSFDNEAFTLELISKVIEDVLMSIISNDEEVRDASIKSTSAVCSSSSLISSQDSFLSVSTRSFEDEVSADHIITRNLLLEMKITKPLDTMDRKDVKINGSTDSLSVNFNQQRCLSALFLKFDPFAADVFDYIQTTICAMELLLYQPKTSERFAKPPEPAEFKNISNSKHLLRKQSILVQKCIFINESLKVSLEMDCNLFVVPMDVADSPLTPHIIIHPTIGVFLIWPKMLDTRLELVMEFWNKHHNSFDQLWIICVGDYKAYMESVISCQAASERRPSDDTTLIMAMFVTEEDYLGATIADLSDSVPWVVDKLPNIHTHHEEEDFLMTAFPSLNIFAARLILSEMDLLQFLSLTESQLDVKFPWLGSSRIQEIVVNPSYKF